jgi:adenylosuccinate lyase
MGRLKADEKVQALLHRVEAENKSLKDLLTADREICRLLTAEDLEFLDHPERYVGLAVELVEDALAGITAQRQTDPEVLSP